MYTVDEMYTIVTVIVLYYIYRSIYPIEQIEANNNTPIVIVEKDSNKSEL